MVVRYLEGNRDFRIRMGHEGDALDEATDRGIVERCGGTSVFAIHGDLANAADRRYRTWRRFARSRAAWGLFRLLPLRRRMAAAEALERGMRGSNLEFKRAFPESAVREYAAAILARGHDAVVLGHFHVERDLEAAPPSPPGRILVLPEWKGSRRHLRLESGGALRFEPSICS
jgi:UDP-2,3-diacylglucosamine pyrophosphatase LpxH